MSDNIKWSDIGSEIRDAVTESLQTGDFTKLGDCFTDTVSGALNSIFGYPQSDNGSSESKQASSAQSGQKSDGNASSSSGTSTQAYYVPKEETFTEKWIRENKAKQAEEAKRQRELEKNKPMQGRVVNAQFSRVGSVAGVLFSVFGGIGLGFGLLSLLAFKIVTGVTGIALFNIGVQASVVLLAGSAIMLFAGHRKRKLLSKAEKYYNICSKTGYSNIEDIAVRLNIKVKTALKEIKKLIKRGFFPQGHLSKENDCLMLDDRIYNEYLELDKQRRIEMQSTVGAGVSASEKSADTAAESSAGQDRELDTMIAEGESCIKRLRQMNENIPGEEISLKLFRLEGLLKDIFERLKEHPEQKGQMHKFMDYYLPMTLKLVGAYEEFDSLSVQGDDIVEAKHEIERTLDTINDAFSELLNRLFKDAAFDAATDAQVLQTMLAKEGLTNEQVFKNKRSGLDN